MTHTLTLADRIWMRLRRMALRLPPKQFNEREFWREERQVYIDWYNGKRSMYGHTPPPDDQKIQGLDEWDSAVRTVFHLSTNVTHDYARRLHLPADYFSGQKILDIGCGPLAAACSFTDCNILGVEPLAEMYRGLRYPIDSFSERMKYLACPAENIPLPDKSLDAIIAVNALDHVDDFQETASEIRRVLRPEGTLRLEVHYHAPTSCEPQCLTDEMIQESFGELGIKKLYSRPLSSLSPTHKGNDELCLWGNTDDLYTWPSTGEAAP